MQRKGTDRIITIEPDLGLSKEILFLFFSCFYRLKILIFPFKPKTNCL